MPINSVSRSEFLSFKISRDDHKKRGSLIEAEARRATLHHYIDPLTGDGYIIHRKDEEIVARAWNWETVVEYRGKTKEER